MMNDSDKTRITYTGPALPGIGEAVILFSSTVAFGPRCATHYRCYYFDVSIQASQTGSLSLFVSPDGGTTYTQVIGAPIAALAATPVGATPVCFYVAPYADWRVVWVNGGAAQTTWAVDMIIDHTSRGSVIASQTQSG